MGVFFRERNFDDLGTDEFRGAFACFVARIGHYERFVRRCERQNGLVQGSTRSRVNPDVIQFYAFLVGKNLLNRLSQIANAARPLNEPAPPPPNEAKSVAVAAQAFADRLRTKVHGLAA